MIVTPRPVRIVVIANKTWEADPLQQTLLDAKAKPGELAAIDRPYDPSVTPSSNWNEQRPRLYLRCFRLPRQEGQPEPPVTAKVMVWCLEDWMNPAAGGSNTTEKMRVLPKLFQRSHDYFGANPDVVVAFGTAALPSTVTYNGCVSIGTRVFVHDPFGELEAEKRVIRRPDGDQDPMWTDTRLNKLLTSAIGSQFFRSIPDSVRHTAEAKFLKPPVHPGDPLVVLAGHGFASVGTVNVTNYDDYVWTDPQSVAAFRAESAKCQIGSMETTHGLIRLAAEDALQAVPRFFYVSGLVNSLGYFDFETTPRSYAQNFAAAHNAGIATAWLIPALAKIIGEELAVSEASQAGPQ
jgi:hypothetical protein